MQDYDNNEEQDLHHRVASWAYKCMQNILRCMGRVSTLTSTPTISPIMLQLCHCCLHFRCPVSKMALGGTQRYPPNVGLPQWHLALLLGNATSTLHQIDELTQLYTTTCLTCLCGNSVLYMNMIICMNQKIFIYPTLTSLYRTLHRNSWLLDDESPNLPMDQPPEILWAPWEPTKETTSCWWILMIFNRSILIATL